MAGRSASHTVRAHVSEARHRDHRGQFTTGQRTSGAKSRHASRSIDQEAAAQADRQLRGRKAVSGAGISAATQSPLSAPAGAAGGLSRAQAERAGTARDLSPGDYAEHQQRLGGSARWPLAATPTRPAMLWTDQAQGVGLRIRKRSDGSVLPGRAHPVS